MKYSRAEEIMKGVERILSTRSTQKWNKATDYLLAQFKIAEEHAIREGARIVISTPQTQYVVGGDATSAVIEIQIQEYLRSA